MQWSKFAFLLAMYFAVTSNAQNVLTPGKDGISGNRGSEVVHVVTPAGWKADQGQPEDFEMSFHKPGRYTSRKKSIFLTVTAFHLDKCHDISPTKSYIGVNLQHDGEITSLKRLEVFDAGWAGKIPLWQIRSLSDDYVLVVFCWHNTELDVFLRSKDADELGEFVPSLKQLTRSLRFVPADRADGSGRTGNGVRLFQRRATN